MYYLIIYICLNRNILFAGQSPEAFNLLKYYKINKSMPIEELNEIRGSTEIAYKFNLNITLIKGDEHNFKITTKNDLVRYRNIMEE